MAKPTRHSAKIGSPSDSRIYFVTSKSAEARNVLQTERMAKLLIDVLRQYTAAGKFKVYEFVVMRNHFHVLLEVPAGTTVERAMQLIKGGFSYRAKKELGFNGEIWQRGFSDVRITDQETFARHVEYIAENPVRAGYAESAEEYPYCSAYLRRLKKERSQSVDTRNERAKSGGQTGHG